LLATADEVIERARQIVFQPLGKQSALTAVIANDKARHRILRPNRWRIISFRVFSHSLDPFQTSAVHDVGYAKLSRNIIQVSDYLPTALILADSVDDLGRRGY
jgi:hypothetical protein